MATVIIQEKNIRYPIECFGINTSQADPLPENKLSGYAYKDKVKKFGLRRSHDERLATWRMTETAPGVFDWSGMDEWVFNNLGSKLIATIYQTPQFYATDPNSVGAYGNQGQNTPPLDKTKLYNYVVALLSRYKALGITIDYLEVFNEVNIKNFYNGTVSDLAECVRQVRLAMDTISPSTKIIAPSLTNFDPGTVYTADNQDPSLYFPTMIYALDSAGKKLITHCDVLNVHLYGHPSKMLDRINIVKNLQSIYGLTQMPIFNTEVNYKWTTETDEYKKKLLIRALFLPVIIGFPTCFYKLGNVGDTASGYSMTSSPIAFDFLNSILNDVSIYGIDRAAIETTSGALTLRINDIPVLY